MRKFGYGRVSTSKQSLNIQKQALLQAGVIESRIFLDIGDRSNLDRTNLNTLRVKLEEGDEVYVTRLDRLGSNTYEMIGLVNEFHKNNITVHFIKENLSTGGTMGKLIVTILSAIADAEKTRILERTNEGREDAKLRGVKFGRKRQIDRSEVLTLLENGLSAIAVAKQLGIGRSTVYAIQKSNEIG